MEYRIYSTFGHSRFQWDAAPIIVIGAKSTQHAVNIVGSRGFFKSITRAQSRQCEGMPFADCPDWTQPSIEARNANAIEGIESCEQ